MSVLSLRSGGSDIRKKCDSDTASPLLDELPL